MPTTNPFFNSVYPGQSTEQGLIDDLVIEQIAIFGLDVLYMPRKHLNLDKLLHESSKNAFEFAMPIPMYLKTFSGYNNGMEMLTKFGVRSSDELTLVCSRSQFNTHYAPFIKSYYNAEAGRDPGSNLDYLSGETSRPKEGDLLYFPFDDGIFEIKYVMFDEPFFQLGRGYVYELMCEKFEYSGESMRTGYPEIDDIEITPEYYRLNFDVQPDGVGDFIKQERVTIFNASGTDLVNQGWLSLLTEDQQNIMADYPAGTKDFRLYNDPGFLHGVDKIEATVMDWNARDRILTVGDLSDLDPEQKDRETLYIDINKFDEVFIEGQDSGAKWTSVHAKEADTGFNDNNTLQEEFDEIKIIDEPWDQNPFGFV